MTASADAAPLTAQSESARSGGEVLPVPPSHCGRTVIPMHSVSPYPHSALAAWQLALIAIVALGGVAVWLGAVFYAAREPKARDHAVAPHSPAAPASAPAAADSSAAEPAAAATAAAGARS